MSQGLQTLNLAPKKAPPTAYKFQITQPSRSRFLKGIFFGPYGSGKTRFVCTANEDERTAPAFLVNFEGGESSVAGTGIDMVRVTDWDTYTEVFDYLTRADHGYKSVLLDSLTETHTSALFTILDSEGDKRKNPNLIEQGDYGTASVQLRRLIRHFRDLPMSFLATALDMDETDPRDGWIKKPALAGKLANELPGIVDVVGYLTTAEVEGRDVRAMILQNQKTIRAKVRVPKGVEAPDFLLDLSVTALLNALKYEL